MKLLGAHMSIAGGVDLAPGRGGAVGCEALQIFTKSSNQWKARPLEASEVERFAAARAEHGIRQVVAHDSYLINLASPDAALYARSKAAFGEELDRCRLLAIPVLIAHPGSHVGSGLEAGIDRIASAIDALLKERPDSGVSVLLETTAGQGDSVGHRFEHLREIRQRVSQPDRVGVCVDTCHIFAAGYDIRTERGYHEVFEEFDRIVGIDRIGAFHLNDCKKDLGCRVDRHEEIGKGFIGVEAFRLLMNDERFEPVPMVLETPKGEDCAEDAVALRLLRSLQKKARR